MAELPRYQQTGRIFADVPTLDFADVRESFKRSQSMAASLDRMASFAGKFAEKAVEQQAEQWAVDNQITLEQLDAANKQGLTADDLLKSSGGGTIWQETIRKMQGEQLRVQLENVGREKLSQVQRDIELGVLDPTDSSKIAAKIQAIGNGIFAPLKGVNPDSYVKGLASFGVHATSVYNDARKKSVEDAKNASLMIADKNLVTQLELDKVAIEGLNDWPSLLAAKETSVNRIYETYAVTGDTTKALEKARAHREAYDNLLTNSFVKFTSTGDKVKDYNIVTKMMAGDFGDERKNAIFASMPYEVQDKIVKAALERRNNNLAAIKHQEEADKITHREEIAQNKAKLFTGKLPRTEAVALATTMAAKGWISDELFKSIIKPPAEDEGNQTLLGQLKYKLAYGVYKSPYEVPEVDMARLSDTQRGQLWSFGANMGAQKSFKETNAFISDNVKNGADAGKLDTLITLEKIKDDLRAGKPAGQYVDEGALHQEALIKLQSDQNVQMLLQEQQSAYTAISKIPAVAGRMDKFDPSNVESFIKAYGSELDKNDIDTLRRQSSKFLQYPTKTLKTWKQFSQPTTGK